MYPGTKIQLFDDSRVAPIISDSTISADSRPLYAVFFTSPRGPEKFTILEGSQWAKTYLSNNTPNFNKDGQPLLQAAMDANAGARLFSKRIVADNAVIANTTFALMVTAKDKEVNTYKYYTKVKKSGSTAVDITGMPASEVAKLYKETTTEQKTFYYDAIKGEPVADISGLTPEEVADLIHEEDQGQDYYWRKAKASDATPYTDEEVEAMSPAQLAPLYHETEEVTVNTYYPADKSGDPVDISALSPEQIAALYEEPTTEYDSTHKTLNIRPVYIAEANANGWAAAYAGKSKDLLYGAAQEDIIKTITADETYAYSETQEGDKATTLMIINPDSHAETAADKVAKLYTDPDATFETGKIYPLFTVFDSGRGKSDKTISLVPNYTISKSNNKMVYSLNVIDANNAASTLETWTIAIDPKLADSNLNSLDPQTVVSGNSYLIDVKSHYNSVDALVEDIAELGFSDSIFGYYDILGKRTLGGKSLSIPSVITEDGIEYSIGTSNVTPLADAEVWTGSTETDSCIARAGAWTVSESGFTNAILAFGDNGIIPSMKASKASETAFYAALNDVLTGKYSMDIYNLDLYTFDCIFDANYDNRKVKDNIQKLCAYRGDCVCFMDMGFACKSIEDVRRIKEWNGIESSVAEDNPPYHYFDDQAIWVSDLYYDIKNPFDGRQITVTVSYSASIRMVDHFVGGRERAFAGQTMGITIPEAIQGTVNYIPKIYPLESFTSEDINMTYPSDSAVIINEKQEMCDLKVNYACYYNGVLTIDTLYTTYSKDSALSYVNNIMGAQLIVKEIRKACPEITRYKFIDGNNLTKFQEDIQDRVIDRYLSMFKSIKFTYIEDPSYLENKIFYGAIRIAFRDFTQSEFFKVTVINGNLNA